MYQVSTKNNRYAVKKLNSLVMKRKGVLEHIIDSERIPVALKESVPVVSAKLFNDNSVLVLNKQYYMIFDWLDGNSIFPPHISTENCSQIGKILGKIHTAEIEISGVQKEISETPIYEWDKYLQLGQETNEEWVSDLITLKKWNRDLKEANCILGDNLVLSHKDLDPKNVMWKDNKPFIIDWESAGYVNPHQELLEILNYWSDDGSGKLNKNNFDALYNAYKQYNGCYQVNWELVIASGFGGMLGWLDYSFKRSLGIEAESIEEKKLGAEQAVGTIRALKQYAEQTTLLKSWLEV